MHLLVNHFAALGHRHIGIIAPPDDLMFGKLRIEGFHSAMTGLGLDVNSAWIVTGDMTQRSGAEAVTQLLSCPAQPTAIIAGNDLMAIGAMSHLQQQGYEVPRDFSIGGFDDIPPAAHTNPPLTTIHQPIYRIARTICEMLIQMLNDKLIAERQVLLTLSLIHI